MPASLKSDKTAPASLSYDLSNPQVLLAWQRNHLANERTFLAWCRTGLALFGFSFVIERFDFFIRQIQAMSMFSAMTQKHLHTEAITMATFAAGVLVMIVACWRFWYIRRCINTGATSFSVIPDIIFTVAVVGIIIGLFTVFWHLFVQ
jgi:putative membrane protein